ncbi:MAG: hypothetical protein ACQCN4_01415 [Candidatus Bathyarchaeia archaeon]
MANPLVAETTPQTKKCCDCPNFNRSYSYCQRFHEETPAWHSCQ